MRPSGYPGSVCDVAPRGGDRAAGFRWIILQRDGRRPLAIDGRLVLTAGNGCAGFPYQSEIAIYETSAGALAVAICHSGPTQAGPPWRDAWLSGDPLELRATLRAHNPQAVVPFFLSGDLSTSMLCANVFVMIWRGLLGALLGAPALGRPPA
jgi:hypothetical protein